MNFKKYFEQQNRTELKEGFLGNIVKKIQDKKVATENLKVAKTDVSEAQQGDIVLMLNGTAIGEFVEYVQGSSKDNKQEKEFENVKNKYKLKGDLIHVTSSMDPSLMYDEDGSEYDDLSDKEKKEYRKSVEDKYEFEFDFVVVKDFKTAEYIVISKDFDKKGEQYCYIIKGAKNI